MEIVIDIPEESYIALMEIKDALQRSAGFEKFIVNGTPLQEHGRLCDLDELVKNIVKEYGVNSIHELPQDIKMFYEKFVDSAPTILDATFDYKIRNYAFFRKEKE